MPWKMRFQLIWRILIGRYAYTNKYYHPRVGISEITLRERSFDWYHDREELKEITPFCTIEPRCVGYDRHGGGHTYI